MEPPQNSETTDQHPEAPVEVVSSAEPHTDTLRGRQLLGAAFLAISALGAFGVFVALMPPPPQPVDVQLAAAAARRSEPFLGIELTATSASVYDVRRDSELFSKNSSAQLPLASLTKVALVLAAAEVLPLEDVLTISREAVERGGGGLTWGEEWRVRDLIDYTLITSSNTGAEALAEAARTRFGGTASSTDATLKRMNELARQLGMHETYFLNATGLDESTTQAGAVGSARDITQLFAYALRAHADLFSRTRETDIALGPLNYPERPAHDTNDVDAIPGLLMGKTGTTDLAGGNLAIAFLAEEDRPIIVVVLGSTPEGRFSDVQKLVEAARKSLETE